MLGGLKPLGVVGLGILPGPLRKPLGVSRLVGPEDYAGKTLGVPALPRRRADAARARRARRGDPVRGRDRRLRRRRAGGRVDRRQRLRHGRQVSDHQREPVAASHRHVHEPKAFDELNGRQRAALRDAARVALPATLAIQQAEEQRGAGNLCRRGVTSSRPAKPTWRRCVARCSPSTTNSSATRRPRPRSSRSKPCGPKRPPPPTRRHAPTPARQQPGIGKATPIDGVYRVHTTPEDLRAAGASERRGQPRKLRQLEDGPRPRARHATTAGGRLRRRDIHRRRPHGHADLHAQCRRPARGLGPARCGTSAGACTATSSHSGPSPGKVSPPPMLRQAVAANRQRALIRNAMMPRGRAGSPAGARSLCRDLDDDPSARSRRAVDAEPPAERLDAISETAQARPASRVGAAHAVVDDLRRRVGLRPGATRSARATRTRISRHW